VGQVESVRSIQARSAGRAPTCNTAPSVVALVLVCPPAVLVSLPRAFFGMVKSLEDHTLGANTAIAAADGSSRFNDDSLNSIFSGAFSSGWPAGG
jgi:hypothetical protein